MFIAVFVAYYMLGIRRQMGMGVLLTHTENGFGSIANILLILGISATIHPLTMGGITLTDILVVVLSSLLLFMAAFTFRSKKLDRWEGAIFLAIYIAYIWYLVR